MLDSALAVLHDFNSFIPTVTNISNETLALAVIYFLVDFHKIKINLGSATEPWYTVLCRNVQIDEIEFLRQRMEYCLIGIEENQY
uniref:Cyclin N-terminal domain-containing protein n=1 Tax=Caenorhabditis tropicalis TaxID=1561998 RepID=A0A1I7V0S1_9PELO